MVEQLWSAPMSPQKRFQFGQNNSLFHQDGPPGGYPAQALKLFSIQGQRRPSGKPTGWFQDLLQNPGLRFIGTTQPELQSKHQLLRRNPPCLPLNIKTNSGLLCGMISEKRLVGIALIKAWIERVPSIQIQKMRQHLDDPRAAHLESIGNITTQESKYQQRQFLDHGGACTFPPQSSILILPPRIHD